MSSTAKGPAGGPSGPVPHHVAIIMDGNGRWARERGLPRPAGHKAGMTAVREVTEGALIEGVRVLTIFAFSQENWHRPAAEIAALMLLLQEYIAREAEDLRDKGVRVRMLGDLDRLTPVVRKAIDRIETITAEGDRLDLNVCLSYGARAELVRAARTLATQVQTGARTPESIDEAAISGALYTAPWPDPDLLIRTSGELRLSNFLLWQLAYAEIHVTPVFWPDFTRADLAQAIAEYRRRDRRFGRASSAEVR